jgi:ABC-type sugar transport system ATPase subunit
MLELRAEHLIKTYKKRTVVNDVSFNVKQGEIVGLLGPNGAGKTTSFYMIVGLIKPNAGKIFLQDEDITQEPMYKRAQKGIGYLAQEASVFRKLTVEENILAILEMTKLSKSEQKDKLEELIEEFSLTKVRKNQGDLLSGGERRRTEIARAIFGLDKIDSGEILLKGHKIEIRSPKDAIEKGIAYVSEDRKALGFIPEMSIIENISLSTLKNYSKGGFIQTKKETKVSSQMAGDLKIKAAGLNQKVINLSGGNQQKIVIAKALLTSPAFLILDEPTRGIDIGAKHEIYKLINKLANNGLAVIIISSELPEILGMSDRILVLSKGKQTAILTKQEASQETIMHYAIH